MKRRRLVAVLLIGILLITAIALPVSAAETKASSMTDEDAARIGLDTFQAWYTLNYTNYSYFLDEYEGANRKIVEQRKKSPVFQSLLALWRTATFNVTSEVEYAEKEVGYYEAFLFDMLYEEESESFITEFTETASDGIGQFNAYTKAIGTSAWKSLCELDAGWIKEIDLPSVEEDSAAATALANELGKVKELSGALSLVGDITKYLSYADNIIDLINKLSQIQAIVNMSAEKGVILSDVGKLSSSNPALKLAIVEYGSIMTGSMGEKLAAAILTGKMVVTEAVKSATDAAFKAVISAANLNGLGFSAGQKLGKLYANTLFNTDQTIANYYELAALYDLETLLITKVKSYESKFLSTPTEENARIFNESVRMLFKIYINALDLTAKYMEANYRTGAITSIFPGIDDAEYNSIQKSISGIQNQLRIFLRSNQSIALSYYLDVLETISAPMVVELTPTPIAPEVEEDDLASVFQQIRMEAAPFGFSVVDEDWTLTEDQTIYGDVNLKSGVLNLNGHTLTIYGDLHQTGGTLSVAKGTLNVKGDYRIAKESTNSAGEATWAASSGYLSMTYDEDSVDVGGSFTMYSSYGHINYLTAGTLSVAGDFEELKSSSYNFAASGTHTVILNGTQPQRVSFGSSNSQFAKLVISNPSQLTIGGYFGAATLESDSQTLSILSEDMHILSLGMTGQTVTITGDVWKDSGDWTFAGGSCSIAGDLSQTNGTIAIQGGELSVNGSVCQSGGTMTPGKGSLKITGDYRIAKESTNSAGEATWAASSGYLSMTYDEDSVDVGGSFTMYSSYGHINYLTAGTLSVAGDFEELKSSNYNFAASGTHTVILNGTQPQRVSFESSSSQFAKLVINNPSQLTIGGYFGATTLESDSQTLSILSEDMHILGLGTTGQTVTITGDVWKDSGDWTFAGGSCILNGDLRQTNGTVAIQGGELSVSGNVYQSGGTMTPGKGSLKITGDYRIAKESTNSAGERLWASSSGYLSMTYNEDRVIIGGSFTTYSSGNHTNYLTAGTMSVAGDFEELKSSNYNYNFTASGTHTVILNGTQPQKVSFASSSSQFAKLVINNPSQLTIGGYFGAATLESDSQTLSILSEDMHILGLGTTGQTVTITGDVWKDSGDWTFAGGSCTINGTLRQTSGTIALQGGTLLVRGNVYQSGGTMVPGKGTLKITGDYRIAKESTNSAGEATWASSSGYLSMTYNEDRVIVGGSFTTCSSGSHASYLTAGTMSVAGDFEELKGSNYNFTASGTHTVILNGTQPQSASFASTSSQFNILQLTQPRSQYTFNPEPCWNTLQENVIPSPEFDLTLIAYGTCGDNLTWTLNKDGLLRIFGTGAIYDYELGGKANNPMTPWFSYKDSILNIVCEEGVTGIGEYAFAGLTSAEHISLPETTVYIGNRAFINTGIESMTVPDTVTEMGEYVFAYCENLTGVQLPDSITEIPAGTFSYSGLTRYEIQYGITAIGAQTFYGCESLETVILPETVTSIGESAFMGSAITHLDIPESVVSISDSAFKSCNNLIEIALPDSVTDMGRGLFHSCDALEKVSLPAGLTSVPEWTFYNCTALESLEGISMPNSVTEIGSYAFANCTALKSVSIPTSVTAIKDYAFQMTKGPNAIEHISLPDGLTEIGTQAFYGNTNLTSITIPGTVTNIGDAAFACRNSSLTEIYFAGSAPAIGTNAFGSAVATACYPANDATWTEEVMQDYGGTLDWVPVGDVVSVTGITLDKSEITLNLGETATLTAAVQPANASNQTVTWSTSDASVATVENGVITPVSAGTATITVTTRDGNKTASCEVTVVSESTTVAVTGVTLNKSSLTLTVGQAELLHATVLPDNASNKSVTWTSSDPSVAEVSYGMVSPVSAGTATITVTTEDGQKTASCEVTVVSEPTTVAVTGVTLDQSAVTLNLGETATLTAAVQPANASNQTVTWSTSDASVATVENSVITPVSAGTATITVTTEDGQKTASCTVTVLPDEPADSPTILVSSARGQAGQTVDVTISLKNNPGITSMKLNVNYDSSVLTLTDVEDAGVLGTAYHNPNLQKLPYILAWGLDTADYQGNEVLATLRFTIAEDAADGEYEIDISYDEDEIYNADLQNVGFAVDNGQVTVITVMTGDTDGDGKITAKDRTYLARYLAGWEGYDADPLLLEAMDVNGDGKVTTVDRVILARHLAGWEGYETLPYTTK